MTTGTWTTGEARERAAFVLGVDAAASTEEAQRSYRRQLRLFAGDDEHARAARRTLMAAWAVWNDTVPDLRLLSDDSGPEADVLDLARAERERRLAAAHRDDAAGEDAAGQQDVQVLEVVRDAATADRGTALAARASGRAGTVIGVWRPVVGGTGFVVDDARAHRAYHDGEWTPPDERVSVRV